MHNQGMKFVDSVTHPAIIPDTLTEHAPSKLLAERPGRKSGMMIGVTLVMSLSLTSMVALFFSGTADEGKEPVETSIVLPKKVIPADTPGGWPALANVDFFNTVKAQLIEEQSNFIESDLSEMKLRVYKGGNIVKEVPILSKGREGSWWETPAGLYKVQGKEVNHFSSFGQVNMPWSMPFQGNFFIHGWPTYPNGEPVPEGYSGGCIRLSIDDAEEVFKLADVGMPVIIFEEDFQADEFSHGPQIKKDIDVKSFLSADMKSGFIFSQKSPDKTLPIASLTKLMTALIATEYINIEKETTITEDMLVYTSKPRLEVGQRISVFDLLFPLLMESSNEAGVAISKIIGEDRFVRLMNEKAKAVGMENTHFVDATGADADNISTTEDLFQLAKYLYNNRSFILDITKGGAKQSVYGAPAFQELINFNLFEDDEDFVGGKVGMTNAAKGTILSIFEIEVNEEIRPVVIIILGSGDLTGDAVELIGDIRGK